MILYSDVVKMFLLISFFMLSFYSAFTKFSFTGANENLFKLQPNFVLCDNIRNCAKCSNQQALIKTCRNEIASTYKDAETKCKGYLKNLNSCKTARQSQCSIEFSNVEGCVSSVTNEVITKWRNLDDIH